MNEPPRQPAEPPNTTGITPDVLAAVRARMVEAAKNASRSGDASSFRRFKAAREAIREIDAMAAEEK